MDPNTAEKDVSGVLKVTEVGREAWSYQPHKFVLKGRWKIGPIQMFTESSDCGWEGDNKIEGGNIKGDKERTKWRLDR